MILDRYIRKVFPSLSKLTYSKPFQWMVNIGDLPVRLWFKEFRNFPPNHMRIRIGVGNNLLANHIKYLNTAKDFWLHSALNGFWNLKSTIIDVGCGSGRYAHHLRDYTFKQERFEGKYIGIDIDEDAINWSRKNFDKERFEWHLSPHASSSYNKEDGRGEYYKLPVRGGTTDLVFSTSLFTHLLEDEMLNYIKESFRVLKKGGHMHMAVFCLDYPPPTYGIRHTFKHKMGNAQVESIKQPEAAVAYTEKFLLSTCKEIGFSRAEILHAKGDFQPVLLCKK